MKKKLLQILSLSLAVTSLTGCNLDFTEYAIKLDEINPAINNDFGLRVSVIDGVDNNEVFGSTSENEYFNTDDVIENGTEQINHHKVTDDKLNRVNDNTLTNKKIKELESNGSVVEDAIANVPIVANSVAGGSYVQDYLKKYSSDIISSIENKKKELDKSQSSITPKFYFNIAYSGLDVDESGKKKWVNYSASYIPSNMDSYIFSDVVGNLMQINNWYNIRANLENAYTKQKQTAQEFGNSTLKVNGNSKVVKDCTVEELTSNNTERVKAQYNPTWRMLQNSKKGKYVYTTYQEFLNSYKEKPNTSFSNAANASKVFTQILPEFTSSYGVNWCAYGLPDDPTNTKKVRLYSRIKLSAVNSIFRSNTNVNRDNIGTDTIFYKDKNEYGGTVYYFENRNHRLVATVYCTDLNSAGLSSDVKNFVLNLIDTLKNPTELNATELRSLRQIRKGV